MTIRLFRLQVERVCTRIRITDRIISAATSSRPSPLVVGAPYHPPTYLPIYLYPHLGPKILTRVHAKSNYKWIFTGHFFCNILSETRHRHFREKSCLSRPRYKKSSFRSKSYTSSENKSSESLTY
jgi:hypothetical protein